MIIHQIYGLFKDNKPMNELFSTGSTKWREYCDRNGHIYKLWNAEEVEELVNTYTNIKEYFYGVKYPVMKVDIARFLIIYSFGGMYVDLDVLPNKNMIEIDETKLYLCNYLWTPQGHLQDKSVADIEIIHSPKYNIDLFNFIAFYVPSQIEEKNKIEIYEQWKIRYIFQTTGPVSFRRFMKKNKIIYENIDTLGLPKYVKINDNIDIENDYGNLDYDCLSYFSLSYNPHGNKNMKYKKYEKKNKCLTE
tara:strand:- start:69 stop:812 length:744 start_codon:yes stop_codon:yes gene_type:complete